MDTDIDALLLELTDAEKAGLTAGADFWSVGGLPERGIPPIVVTDGPNGARGSSLLGTGVQRSVCVPCGSALGATWNPDLVSRVGRVLGAETRTKGARVLLAPTVNLHRSPTAGRNFECYSEDPLLTAHLASAFVDGVQREEVAATVKHFIGNETEYKRNLSDSVIDERAFRELYALPFEAAVVGGVRAVMTSYNRVNGEWPAESTRLLGELLRKEWGFGGIVMTDWFGAIDTVASARAGLDLEMPGPARRFGPALLDAVSRGDVDAGVLDQRARRWLGLIDALGAWHDPQVPVEKTIDRPEHRDVARDAAIESMVLLRNDGLLPLEPSADRTVCLVGPNAAQVQMMGGGSAQLRPHYELSPLEVLTRRYGDRLRYEPGCFLGPHVDELRTADLVGADGSPGALIEIYSNEDFEGEPVERSSTTEPCLIYSDVVADGIDPDSFSYRVSARMAGLEPGRHLFSLVQIGRARLLVDGEVVIDGTDGSVGAGDTYFGLGSAEMRAEAELGDSAEIVLEYSSQSSIMLHGCRVGHRAPDDGTLIGRAAAAAAESDVAVVVVGTNAEWETEGSDRASMALPGDQRALIERVCAANPNTVVVLNAGSAVDLGWIDRPAAVLNAWFGGQEMAHAIDLLLHGEADPGGRMPLTVPLRLEHNPSFGNFPGDNNAVVYAESILMGYRWYQTRKLPVALPFGHGLSFATFEWANPLVIQVLPSLPAPQRIDRDPVVARVTVDVTNTGEVPGFEVVQLYVRPVSPTLERPMRELKAFRKLHLLPGESVSVTMDLGARAFAYWDPGDPRDEQIRSHLPAEADLVPHDKGPVVHPDSAWRTDDRFVIELARSSEDVVSDRSIDWALASGFDG